MLDPLYGEIREMIDDLNPVIRKMVDNFPFPGFIGKMLDDPDPQIRKVVDNLDRVIREVRDELDPAMNFSQIGLRRCLVKIGRAHV